MPGFSVSYGVLGNFIAGVRKGLSRKAAWERLRSPYSLQTAYDLWNRLRRCQSVIRTRLYKARPPPRQTGLDSMLQTKDRPPPPATDRNETNNNQTGETQ